MSIKITPTIEVNSSWKRIFQSALDRLKSSKRTPTWIKDAISHVVSDQSGITHSIYGVQASLVLKVPATNLVPQELALFVSQYLIQIEENPPEMFFMQELFVGPDVLSQNSPIRELLLLPSLVQGSDQNGANQVQRAVAVVPNPVALPVRVMEVEGAKEVGVFFCPQEIICAFHDRQTDNVALDVVKSIERR